MDPRPALLLGLLSLAPPPGAGDETPRLEHYERALAFASRVEGGSVTPHWMPDGESFWYAAGGLRNREIRVVRPEAAASAPLLDVARVRAALAAATGREPRQEGLPFAEIDLRDGGEVVRFAYRGAEWDLRLADYSLAKVAEEETARARRRAPQRLRAGFTVGDPPILEIPAPDGELLLGADEEGNLGLRRAADDARIPLTADGEERWAWGAEEGAWSPDGKRVAAMRSDERGVPLLPVVDWLRTTEEVEFHPYPRAGQPLPLVSVHVIEVESGRRVAIEGTGRPDEYAVVWGWRIGGAEVVIGRLHREFQKLELLAADPTTGTTRIVLTETADTFLGGLELLLEWRRLLTEVGDGERFLWMSERDGWRHLYLYDWTGRCLGPVTSGEFPVVQVVAVDGKAGRVFFTAHGEPDPGETHLYGVGLDGTGFARLTEGSGEHAISFSPGRGHFADTFSSPQTPPRTEYRRADGALVCTVAAADIHALTNERWMPPEKFVAPAADGVTELHGLLYKPHDFDPGRKYPVLDNIYNGPFVAWVPRTFVDGRSIQAQALAELGFVVLLVDGRGTPGRGKAFQDVVYRSFGQNEVPDHVSALRALAAERPYLDLDRVGIFGGSWGGYMTVRAMLLYPDVYKAGVAAAAVSDLYDHHASPIEGYMGTPASNAAGYETASNLKLADRLEGELLLIHGTSDVNATFSATMKMTDALIRAGKRHDLIVVPAADHSLSGAGGQYAQQATREFFQRHLHPERIVPVE
ncbi:MAG: DPP IV N-terminal domain-containing protein [Planctomycetota bacterium]